MHDDGNEHRTRVLRATRGEQPALDDLLVEHLPQLRAFVHQRGNMLPRGRESETDVVQSACREALAALSGDGSFEYRSRSEFVAWLYEIALSKIVQKQRFHHAARRDVAREAQRDAGDDAVTFGAVYATFTTPSQVAIAREQLDRIAAAFDRLPPDYQRVIKLRRVLGLPYPEIAAQMERSEDATRVLFSRAAARLAALQATS